MLFNESLLTNGRLAPGFASPDPRNYGYREYSDHLEKGLRDESPVMYGMHPNAEIGYLTSTTDSIFSTILRLRVGSGASSGAGGDTSSSATKDAIADLLSRLPRKFAMADLQDRADEAVQGVRSHSHRETLSRGRRTMKIPLVASVYCKLPLTLSL